mmetsp:Transcript_11043/g.13961  ORF Transcript_11043/g.13961 Transcript_11043/m.13961 type:complete len:113 (-) Transcript_11043:346-684(-)
MLGINSVTNQLAFFLASTLIHMLFAVVLLNVVELRKLREVSNLNAVGSLELHTYFNLLYFFFSLVRDSVLQTVILIMERPILKYVFQYRFAIVLVDSLVLFLSFCSAIFLRS